MNEENALDNEESGTNKSRHDGVLSTDCVCGLRRMNEENVSDDKESGTNMSRRYGVLSTDRACGSQLFSKFSLCSSVGKIWDKKHTKKSCDGLTLAKNEFWRWAESSIR